MENFFAGPRGAVESLSAYAAAVGQSLDVEAVLDRALDALVDWSDIDIACVYLPAATGELRQAAHRAQRQVVVYAIDLVELATDAAAAREPTITNLATHHPSGLRTVATFPLLDAGELVGVLILGSQRGSLQAGMQILTGAAGLLAAALANAQQYQHTRHARKRLAVLHTTLTQIQRATSLRDKLQIIANALHNMGWGNVTLWLCEDDLLAVGSAAPTHPDELVVVDVVYAGISWKEEADLRRTVPPGVEVYCQLPEQLEPFRLGTGYLVPQSGELVPGQWQSGDAVYIPLQSGPPDQRRIVGSIELRDPTDEMRPTEEQLSVVELFAHEAAHEIERARQADQQRQQLLDLTVLYETGAAVFSYRQESAILALANRVLRDTTRADYVCFVELDLEGRTARRLASYQRPAPVGQVRPDVPATFSLTPDLIERVVERQQPHVVRPPGQSVLYLPVALSRQILGMFEIRVYRPEHTFAGREMAVCRAMTNQAAIALSHLRLYQRTATERSRLRAILEASLDGIMLISPEATIVDLNGAACRLLRLEDEPEDWRGRRLVDLFNCVRDYAPAAAQAGLDQLGRIERGDRSPGRGEFEVGGGVPIFVRYVIYPIQATGLQMTGWLLLLHDATEERALTRMRDDLTHMLVHDLRTPLTSITSAINILGDGLLGQVPDDQQGMLDIIQRSSERMMEMVNNILSVAGLETGRVPLERRAISPAKLIAETSDALTPAVEERRIGLVVELAADLPPVYADWGMTERVLSNLVNNAIKFTPPDGQITLRACVEGNSVVFSVEDTGPGIEPELRDHLFQKFAAGKLEGRGSGLGLAFCKLAIEAHGGRIWVDSPAPGRPAEAEPGSLFSFSLPVAV